MSKGAILTAGDDVADHFLVDYEKKTISDMKEKRRLEEEEEEAARAGPEYEMGATDVPGPVDPQDQWEKDDKEKAMKQETLPDLLSSDMHRKMMRKKWEAEEEEMRSRGPGPLHYQNLKFDEESQWDRVKKQVHEERPQEFAPPQQYNWMMPSMRQTPKKKSKFASTESCDDTLNTSKQPQEFTPPSNSAKWNMRQGLSASTSLEA
ncbi:coiled-coil domain-containing protein 174-like isoform X1 [Asterias rubens]|uniref:coiled-coil domain-containing protein 174-like isoform X1 n=1 Tax=Asterias rubens TaxID=7604 RepID=UPI0014559A29|nr:coiled-coil domain-containing protein 174-like isoform X1 [Asterias rubens]XP_033646285.1 coiled-coil domain-containing protein 174-like isoform X1 [Asterias rubens]